MFGSREKQEPFVLIIMFNAQLQRQPQQKVKNNYMPFNYGLKNLQFKWQTDLKIMTMYINEMREMII